MPSVVITTTGFSTLAKLTGKSNGIKNLNVAEYPGPLGIHDFELISHNVESVLLDQIINALTSTQDLDENIYQDVNPRDIAFSGTDLEIQSHFDSEEWSDGLPIIPPTIERIEKFLKFTNRLAFEEIAILPTANLQATPWNIAVNAVMAGCIPEHMPILIAAVEALGDERCNLANIGSSSSLIPFILINGPIVEKLSINSGAQLISRAPNPAIGRAVGLIVRNIAGYRPGSTYMGTFGYPLAFALAEKNDDAPWEPFHVEHGFNVNDSTVTIGITSNWGSSPAPYDRPEKNGAETTLEMLSKEILKKTRMFMFPGRGPNSDTAMITILISLPIAKSLASAGYTKNDIKKYLVDNTKMTLREFDWLCRYMSISGARAHEKVAEGVYPDEFKGDPDSLVKVLATTDILHIIVCGDPNRNRLMVMEGGHANPATKRIYF